MIQKFKHNRKQEHHEILLKQMNKMIIYIRSSTEGHMKDCTTKVVWLTRWYDEHMHTLDDSCECGKCLKECGVHALKTCL